MEYGRRKNLSFLSISNCLPCSPVLCCVTLVGIIYPSSQFGWQLVDGLDLAGFFVLITVIPHRGGGGDFVYISRIVQKPWLAVECFLREDIMSGN
jgi:hypothetical protein